MLTAVVTQRGELFHAQIVLPRAAAEGEEAAHEEVDPGPSPIAPELKELFWGGGSFIVLLVLMRLFLFPRVKQGMDARYALIRSGHEGADQARAAAQAEVAGYQAQLAELKAEAGARVDAARQQLESERSARLAEANTAIAARRSEATAQAASERAAASDQVGDAVASVSAQLAELAIGRSVDPTLVRTTVDSVVNAGVAR